SRSEPQGGAAGRCRCGPPKSRGQAGSEPRARSSHRCPRRGQPARSRPPWTAAGPLTPRGQVEPREHPRGPKVGDVRDGALPDGQHLDSLSLQPSAPIVRGTEDECRLRVRAGGNEPEKAAPPSRPPTSPSRPGAAAPPDAPGTGPAGERIEARVRRNAVELAAHRGGPRCPHTMALSSRSAGLEKGMPLDVALRAMSPVSVTAWARRWPSCRFLALRAGLRPLQRSPED